MTERENLGDLGVDGVIKLQLLSKNGEWKLNELNCVMIGYLSVLLWTSMKVSYCNSRVLWRAAEQLSATHGLTCDFSCTCYT
jgi:hypothetical protein